MSSFTVVTLEKRRGLVRILAEALAECTELDRTPLLRFIEKHSIPEPNTGCWLWEHTLSHKNYASITDPRKPIRYLESDKLVVSRLVCEAMHGNLPPDLVARHTCDNPPCVNPSHLIPGTKKDNTQDSLVRGRYRVMAGEAHGRAKLSDVKVVAILSREFQGTEKDEAAYYGVNTTILSGIRQGKLWKHLLRPEISRERLWDPKRPVVTPEKINIIRGITDWSRGTIARLARELCITRGMVYGVRRRLAAHGADFTTHRNFYGRPWKTAA